MRGSILIFWGLVFLINATTAFAESPVRGKYIQPPAVQKPVPTPSPTPNSALIEPCGPNVAEDTCRIPSSKPTGTAPDASSNVSAVRKPEASDPLKAAPTAPQKHPTRKKALGNR